MTIHFQKCYCSEFKSHRKKCFAHDWKASAGLVPRRDIAPQVVRNWKKQGEGGGGDL